MNTSIILITIACLVLTGQSKAAEPKRLPAAVLVEDSVAYAIIGKQAACPKRCGPGVACSTATQSQVCRLNRQLNNGKPIPLEQQEASCELRETVANQCNPQATKSHTCNNETDGSTNCSGTGDGGGCGSENITKCKWVGGKCEKLGAQRTNACGNHCVR